MNSSEFQKCGNAITKTAYDEPVKCSGIMNFWQVGLTFKGYGWQCQHSSNAWNMKGKIDRAGEREPEEI